MPAPIQGGLWEGLKRRCGVLAFQQPQLVDDVFGVADLTEPPEELMWQQGWKRRFYQAIVAAGGAGQYGCVSIRLLDPLTILVVEGFWSPAAASWEIDSTGADSGILANGGAAVALDWRQLNQPAPLPIDTDPPRIRSGTSGTAPLGFRQLTLAAGWNPFPIVLTPGAGGEFILKFTTANAAAPLGVQWRERPADNLELQR